MTDNPIGSKIFYSIGEVARIMDVEPHVLRFWEERFPEVQPIKRRGRRLYDKENIEQIQIIKDLLYEDGHTIKGVRKILLSKKNLPRNKGEADVASCLRQLLNIRDYLLDKIDGA